MGKLDSLVKAQQTAADSVAAAVQAQVVAEEERPAAIRVAPVATIPPKPAPRTIVSTEVSERITVILPESLLEQLEQRIAGLRRRKRASVSGYIEAAIREMLASGDRDIDALDRYGISARRKTPRAR